MAVGVAPAGAIGRSRTSSTRVHRASVTAPASRTEASAAPSSAGTARGARLIDGSRGTAWEAGRDYSLTHRSRFGRIVRQFMKITVTRTQLPGVLIVDTPYK